jgi:chromosome segregation ATPase
LRGSNKPAILQQFPAAPTASIENGKNEKNGNDAGKKNVEMYVHPHLRQPSSIPRENKAYYVPAMPASAQPIVSPQPTPVIPPQPTPVKSINNNELQQLKMKNAALQTFNEELKVQNASLQAERQKYQGILYGYEQKHTQLENELDQLKGQNQALTKQVMDWKAEAQRYQGILYGCEEKRTQLENEIDQLKGQNQGLTKQYQGILYGCEQKHTELEKEIDQLKSQNQALTTQVAEWKATLSQCEEEHTKLEIEMRYQSTKNDSLNRQLTENASRFKINDKLIAEARNELTLTKTKLESERNELKKQLQYQSAQNDSLNRQLTENASRFKINDKLIAEVQNELTLTKTKLENENLKDHNHITELENINAVLRSSLQECQKRVTTQADVDQLRKKLAKNKTQLEAESKMIQDRTAENIALGTRAASAESKIKNLVKEMNEKEQQHKRELSLLKQDKLNFKQLEDRCITTQKAFEALETNFREEKLRWAEKEGDYQRSILALTNRIAQLDKQRNTSANL